MAAASVVSFALKVGEIESRKIVEERPNPRARTGKNINMGSLLWLVSSTAAMWKVGIGKII